MGSYRFLFLLATFLCSMPTATVDAQSKHALVIAIGDYKFWGDIASKNDVPYIQSTLLKQGFPQKNITTLVDAKATKAGIENAFKALIAKSQSGDIVFIHFSAHGEQVEDNNLDETDGLDESIVTWDAPKLTGPENYAKEQVKYFRDDQFGQYINELRAKLGKDGDIVVFMDACHSGSGTRGNRKVRGGEPALVSKSFKKPASGAVKATNVFIEEKSPAINITNGLATYVVISAALAEELNYESVYEDGKEGGSLSIAISRVFENLKPETTYRSLFAGILSIVNDIAPDQHPVIEGDGIDRALFGGKFVEQKPYIEIESVSNDKLVLKAGLLMGVDSGSKVMLYPSGTTDPAGVQPIANGIVTAANAYRSAVLLDTKQAIALPAQGWIFLTEPAYKVNPLVIRIGSEKSSINFTSEEEAFIKKTLQSIPLVSFSGEPELVIVRGTVKDSVKIAGNGYLYNTIKQNDPDNLRQQINRYIQYKFLQRIELTHPKYKMDVKLVPWINNKPDTAAISKKTVNGILECNLKDTVIVFAKNNSTIPLYLNILDLQPDGIINAILPFTKIRRGDLNPKIIKPEELKIEPGQQVYFSSVKIKIGPPTGLEIFKIFISDTQIDMEKIADRDVLSRGNFSFLENLVDKSYQLNTRGEVIPGQANGATYNFLFRIK